MNKLSILNQDDRIIFTQICHMASIGNNPTIDTDELLMEIIKWAERQNYAPLRLNQTSKRILQNFCYTLSKLHFCHMKRDENEVVAITIAEPQFEFVDLAYKHMSHEPEAPFPTEQMLTLPLPPTRIVEVVYDKINSKFIEEHFNKDKMIKIIFPELNSHILITPKLMVQLPTLCIKKIGKYFTPSTKVRILDQVLKPIEVILPDKNLRVERVLKVLNVEDKESPIFFIHLTEGLITKLKKESGSDDVGPILQSAIMLKQFKLEQDEKEKENKKEEQSNEDIKRILHIFQKNPRAYFIPELYRFREGEGHNEQFAGSYDKGEFAQLIEKFIQTYAVRKDSAENPAESIPEIITLTDNAGRELLIYREFVVSLLERERLRAKEEFRKYLLDKMIYALENYMEMPEMKKDTALETEAIRFIEKNHKILKFVTMQGAILFEIFKLYENDKEINSKQSFYFYRDKSIPLPYFAILEIRKADLFKEAYSALPFMYRFFLTRLFLFLFTLFKKNPGSADNENSGKDSENSSSESLEPAEDLPKDSNSKDEQNEIRKAVLGNIRKFLPEIEKIYRKSGNIQDILDELHNNWNIKVGEVRTILKEKVDKDIFDRSTAIFRMLIKSPNFSQDFLHRELKNMAIDLAQNKYTEIHDKKSLARYIMLMSIWALRQRNR